VNRLLKDPSQVKALDRYFHQDGYTLKDLSVLKDASGMHFKFDGDFYGFDQDNFKQKLQEALGPVTVEITNAREGCYECDVILALVDEAIVLIDAILLAEMPAGAGMAAVVAAHPAFVPVLLLLAAGVGAAVAAQVFIEEPSLKDLISATVLCSAFGASVGAVATSASGPGIAIGSIVGAHVGLAVAIMPGT